MKKLIANPLLLLVAVAMISGCTTYSVSQRNLQNKDNNHEDLYGISCPNPIYVATMGFNGVTSDTTVSEEKLTLYNLLYEAKKKYGNEVTIQNVRWDQKNKRNISAIFDVIKCK